jgi:hypothetical protein
MSWKKDQMDTVNDLRIRLKDINEEKIGSVDIFMLCLAIGFESGIQGELPPKSSNGVRLTYIKEDNEALIRALALSVSNNSDILLDDEKVLDIAERFAATGLILLERELNKSTNFRQFITGKLFQASKKLVDGV